MSHCVVLPGLQLAVAALWLAAPNGILGLGQLYVLECFFLLLFSSPKIIKLELLFMYMV